MAASVSDRYRDQRMRRHERLAEAEGPAATLAQGGGPGFLFKRREAGVER